MPNQSQRRPFYKSTNDLCEIDRCQFKNKQVAIYTWCWCRQAGWQAGKQTGPSRKRKTCINIHTKNVELSKAKQRQKSESAKAECGMHWCCCYACGCYCCSVCIVWCPDVNQSQMNVRYSMKKKSKSIQLKKSERKACAHFLSLTLYVVHFISICLSDHSFFFLPFHPLISDGCVQQTNAFNRPQISWVIHVPNESSIENLCQPEKNIQHSTAQQTFISNRIFFAEIDKLKTGDNTSRKVSSEFLNSCCSNDFDAFA